MTPRSCDDLFSWLRGDKGLPWDPDNHKKDFKKKERCCAAASVRYRAQPGSSRNMESMVLTEPANHELRLAGIELKQRPLPQVVSMAFDGTAVRSSGN